MRITGRQLRRIIQEEVENMTASVAAGGLNLRDELRINEDDNAPVTDAATYNKEVSTGGPNFEVWRNSMVKQGGLISKMHSRFKNQLFAGGPKIYKVNAVISTTNTGHAVGVTDLTVDGKKPASGLPFVAHSGQATTLFCDCMMELELVNDSRESGTLTAPSTVVWKMIKFRNA